MQKERQLKLIFRSGMGLGALENDRSRMGLPQWLSGKESSCNAGDRGDVGLIIESEDPPGGGMATHSSILA